MRGSKQHHSSHGPRKGGSAALLHFNPPKSREQGACRKQPLFLTIWLHMYCLSGCICIWLHLYLAASVSGSAFGSR